ncbi:histidine kinase [Kutzneria kofuensis]|uniref:Two-component system sensor histidine kinase DesK n=1 Tax=Kutzneria kofuensis TaxID=103725 RepID=A0A7W9NFH1_9PSEU|nr:histidine kinase [Kutzneria kofuensis]MBB5890690.1 two-component system sensor histidine kinase DesK [Kutzneria kofuensis]
MTPRRFDPELGWPLSCFFLLFALPSLYQLATSGTPTWRIATGLTVFAGYAALYVVASTKMWSLSLRWKLVLTAALITLPAFLVWVLGLASTWVFVYGLSLVAIMLPTGLAFAVGLPTLAVTAVLIVVNLGYTELFTDWVVLASVFAATWFMGRLIRANHALATAQEEIARLAAAEERARLAEELRQDLGRSLVEITARAGAVCAELERGGRAAEHVREVEDLAREAVTQVRATVSGYRTASLAAEVVGARAALEAAGITADLPTAVDRVAPAYRETFAYALRDGVTAVLRRAGGATRCEVRLGESWLEVRDNGTASVPVADGDGVDSGLVERVAGIGGRIDTGPCAEGGFRLRVAVP